MSYVAIFNSLTSITLLIITHPYIYIKSSTWYPPLYGIHPYLLYTLIWYPYISHCFTYIMALRITIVVMPLNQ